MSFMDEIEQNPLLKQIFLGTVRVVAKDLQTRAGEMSSDELYENESLIPVYDPERHDYTKKPIGYVCKTDDGIIMRLLDVDGDTSAAAIDEEGNVAGAPSWKLCWSTDPAKAKEFVQLDSSPFSVGECTISEGMLYRSKIDNNLTIPTENAEGWEMLGPASIA